MEHTGEKVGEIRTGRDRRRRPTPLFSRYTFRGRRKGFRRESDRLKRGYVDVYGMKLFILMVSILLLNVLDSIFTVLILNQGGEEVNPFVALLISCFGDQFWIFKSLLVSISLLYLCLHINFLRLRGAIELTCSLYGGVVLYEAYLLYYLI